MTFADPVARPAPPALTIVSGSAAARDPDAVDYLRAAQLPLSSVVMGLFDQSDDCIKLLDADGRLRLMNCNGKRAMQIDDFCQLEGADWRALWPDEAKPLVRQAVETAQRGEVGRFEAFCPTAKGDPRWWDVRVSPVTDAGGKVVAILSASRDITDRHRREEALASIAGEMKHRLRNAYAIGAAITAAAGREQPDHARFASELADRLVRLAEVQASLIDAGSVLGLDALIDQIVTAYHGETGTIMVTGDRGVRVDEHGAKALALVLGELATNSVKYGALVTGGAVEIAVAQADGELHLRWDERHGPGKVSRHGATSRGHGGRLMQRMLAAARGSIDSEATDGGYRALIRLPVAPA